MGSLETPTTTENGSANHGSTCALVGDKNPVAGNGVQFHMTDTMTSESEASKKRKSSILPLDVGTRVMCRWRDGKYHPVKVIERRKLQIGDPNDYEYYVHYTECMIILVLVLFPLLKPWVRVLVF